MASQAQATEQSTDLTELKSYHYPTYNTKQTIQIKTLLILEEKI